MTFVERQNMLRLGFQNAPKSMKSWPSTTYSVWLFTFSDIKTILAPTSVFGLMYAHCAPLFGMQIPSASFLQRMAFTFFWVWTNLLPFNISNQVQPSAIKEDMLNKPWRPLPSGRLTPREAKVIMRLFYFVAAVCSLFWLGGWRQCFLLIMFGYWYNNLEGAGGLISRNSINACGFLCFASGAYEVALGSSIYPHGKLLVWLTVIWMVVFSTVQTQYMFDQAGDAFYDRRTLPLVVGDANARWITAWAMLVWSVCCPLIWDMVVAIHLPFLLLGSLVAIRPLCWRTLEDDKMTFRIWNIWMVFLYSLPFLKYAFQLEERSHTADILFMIRTSPENR